MRGPRGKCNGGDSEGRFSNFNRMRCRSKRKGRRVVKAPRPFLKASCSYIPPFAYKKCANRSRRTEKRKLQVVAKRTYTQIGICTPSNGSRIFTKWILFDGMRKKGIIIPQRKIYLSARLLSSFGMIIIAQFLHFVNIIEKICRITLRQEKRHFYETHILPTHPHIVI